MSYYSKYIKYLFNAVSAFVPEALINSYSKKIILPTYHSVSDCAPDHIRHLYLPRTRKEFIKDLDFILKHYKPIDLHELLKLTREKRSLDHNFFHLSFDDGLKECSDIIAPILKEKGIPATFFINPSFVDNKDLMFRYKASLLIQTILSTGNTKNHKLLHRIKNTTYISRTQLDDLAKSLGVDFKDYLKCHKPYLGIDDIKKIISEGFTVGAHSMDHPEYSHISSEEQLFQTKESIKYVTNTFNINYKVFAFPFNDGYITKIFFDTILNPPNSIADLTFGVAGIKKDYHPFHLQRIPMEKEFSGSSIIKGEYSYYALKKLIGKNSIKRK